MTSAPMIVADNETKLSLLPFATAWLSMWTERGGTVLDSQDGTFAFGWPEYFSSAAYAADQDKLKAQEYFRSLDGPTLASATRHHFAWNDAFYAGGMRTLHELVKAVPGAIDEVKAIVAADPRAGWTPRMRESVA